jgi:hypothetical protein
MQLHEENGVFFVVYNNIRWENYIFGKCVNSTWINQLELSLFYKIIHAFSNLFSHPGVVGKGKREEKRGSRK